MNGILYFSSTGNSLFVAQMAKRRLSGEIRYIPNYHGDGSEYDQIILVSPIYSFGLPAHVIKLLPQIRGSKVHFILTYGGMAAGADRLAYEYGLENGLDVHGVYTLRMVENFTLTFSTPALLNKLALRAVPKLLDGILTSIEQEQTHIPKPQKTKRQLFETNSGNWHLLANDFSVSEDCIHCGKCVALCPSQNITLSDGHIQFGESCVACLGCYHRCPQKAIRYKNKKKRDRYINPDIKETDLGKDAL